jgi:hypothetical protein
MSKAADIKRLNWLIDEKKRQYSHQAVYPDERDIRKAVYKDILEGFSDFKEAEEYIEGLPPDSVIFTAMGWEITFSLIKTILSHIRSNPWYSPWEQLDKPKTIPMTSKTGREGNCYELAWRFITTEDEGTLVHGTVWSPNLKKRIGHAWVVTETGFVYEPVSNQFYDKEWIYKTYAMEEEQTYSPFQSWEMAAKWRHFGPWGYTKGATRIAPSVEKIRAGYDAKR